MMIKAFVSHSYCCRGPSSTVELLRVLKLIELYEGLYKHHHKGVLLQGGHLQVSHGQREFDLKAFFLTGNVFLGILRSFDALDYSSPSSAAVREPLSGEGDDDGDDDGDLCGVGNFNLDGFDVGTLGVGGLGSLSLG
jgi:hypothetical protein